MATPFEITVEELKEWKDSGKDFQLIDVREPSEFAVAQMGGTLIPLGTLPLHTSEIDPDREIVVHCKLGGRSSQATEFLRRNGFPNARNLKGGITAWSDKIDPTVPKY